MIRFIVVLAFLTCWIGGSVLAQSETDAAGITAEEVESRTETVSKTLRCVVCQNQSIYDSNAPLAEDMRRLVQKRIEAGDTNDEAREYLRDKYGDYVLMSPPLQLNTILLWGGPLILIIFGVFWFRGRLQDRQVPEQPALSDEDRARVAAALADEETAG